jgi:hypothetical protein
VKRLDAPRNRRRAAVAAAILSFALPVLTLEATRGAGRAFRFEAREGLDIGAPLLEDPGRAPFAWTDPGAALRMAVGLEPGVAYDFRLESSSAGEVASAGDVPVRDLGAGRGEIVFSLSGKPLPAGEYRLHVLRRIRRAGGEPADLVVPIVVR